MKREVMILVVLVLVAAGMPTAGAATGLSTTRYANVFTERQPVVVTVKGADEVVLRDFAGAEVARRMAVGGGTVDFGQLPPGHYEVSAGNAILYVAVLVDPRRRVRGESRLATDNGQCWLVGVDDYAREADLLRLAGFGWVRERLSWEEVEPERGRWAWGRYDTSATLLAARGLSVYQVFHASPPWARRDGDRAAAPDDLRDIYRFARQLGHHFRGRVRAWEVWNEPDAGFFSHPASECAAFQKAAFLGFRAADARQRVLGPSIAFRPGRFTESLLENGIGAYLDVWNYHIYDHPSTYASRADSHRKLLARHRVAAPLWVTESGGVVARPEGVLTPADGAYQAAFISRALPQALATGVDRHFWFIFPYYREGNNLFGLLHPDRRGASPGLTALATATYALGRGDYLGSLRLSEGDAHAYAFARGDGSAAIAVWRDAEPALVTLPLQWRQVREARNHLGTPLEHGSGSVTVTAGQAATYLLLPARALAGKLEAAPPKPTVTPRPAPGLHAVVTRLCAQGAPVDRVADAYTVPGGQTAPVQAEVYNFGRKRLTGEVRLAAPEGWQVTPARVPVQVAPGDRAVVPVQVTAPAYFSRGEIRLVAAAGRRESAPALLSLITGPADLPDREARPLGLDDVAAWTGAITAGVTVRLSAGPEGGVCFDASFPGPGDNWVYPSARFTPALDLSAYGALRFEYRTSAANCGAVNLLVNEQGGGVHYTGDRLFGATDWTRVTVFLQDLEWMPWMGADASGHLDLSRIAAISFGANSHLLSLRIEVRNLRAVKL